MNIGYLQNSYAYKRNILNILPDVQYSKLHDIYKLQKILQVLAKKFLRIQGHPDTDPSFYFNDFNLNSVDLIHTFNTVCLNSTTPWLTTFETTAPRFHGELTANKKTAKQAQAVAALAGDSCKKIIAMSECNLHWQTSFLQHFPEYRAEVESKLTQLHPPQPLLVDSYESRQRSLAGTVRFMFVGAAFFRKGGMEILEVFQEAKRNKGYNLELYIVSSLSRDYYAAKETERDVAKARKLIHENSDWIKHWQYLKNPQVLALMQQAHVGLLPTYSDTYGYSVLEFQASGCPVITTNVRALPEINNSDTGWLIDVPKNHLGEAIYLNAADRATLPAKIKTGLTHIIDEIMADRAIIERKAKASIKRIADNHAPAHYAINLQKIYQSALA